MNNSIVDVLIQNIQTDQKLLEETEAKIDEIKESKRAIADRLKDHRRDISVMLKYANVEQVKKIEELGFDSTETSTGLNPVATIAFDIILQAKDTKLTNDALYNAYVKKEKNKENVVNYTEFNIKCRSLFNSQKLIRTKGKDPKSSRDDIISLNGSIQKKPVEKSTPKQPLKNEK
ncbi:conserved protein of unknown function [Tenacibaculum sp. 190524A02b]